MDGSKPIDAIKEAEGNQIPPRITVCKDRNFEGDQSLEGGGYLFLGDDWSDEISSFKIHSGEFEFYAGRDHAREDWEPVRLGPGEYPWVVDLGIHNDSISSWNAFYGVGVPAPIGTPVSSEKTATDYAGIDFRNDGTCGRDNQSSWLYNRHPDKRIRLTYHDVASPDKIENADLPPNSEFPKGCHLYIKNSAEFI